MMTLTEAAGGFLNDVLANASVSRDTAVRLTVQPNGLASALDKPRPGDATFEHNGRKVLLLDSQAAQTLEGKVLDVHSTDDGPRLGISDVGGGHGKR